MLQNGNHRAEAIAYYQGALALSQTPVVQSTQLPNSDGNGGTHGPHWVAQNVRRETPPIRRIPVRPKRS